MAGPSWHDAEPRQPYDPEPDPRLSGDREADPGSFSARGLEPGPSRDREPDPASLYARDPGPFFHHEPDTRPLYLEPDPPAARGQEPRADAGTGTGTGDQHPPGGRGRRRAGPRRARWWGTRPTRLGVFIVLGWAAAGAIATVAAKREPGSLLGVFIVAGTVIAGLAVRARSAHVIIPVPALAYLVAGSIAGLIRDRAADTSRTAIITSLTQWFAGGFLAIGIATVLAVAIAAARRPRSGRDGAPG